MLLHRKLDWVEEETGKKAEKFNKIVILKNMYTQQELDVSKYAVKKRHGLLMDHWIYIGRSNLIAGIEGRCPRRM